MSQRAKSRAVESSSAPTRGSFHVEPTSHVEPVASLPPWLEPARAGLVDYARLLATSGTERGLIGPREVPRLWERHLLNCAVVADPAVGLVPPAARIADIGSGAGLPGLVWAIVRPDVEVVLIEALLRRATFLEDTVGQLGLMDRVTVRRARAEDCAKSTDWQPVDVVTARAVAALPTLLGWMIPLMGKSGVALALKGERAGEEVQEVRRDSHWARQQAGLDLTISCVGEDLVDPPTTVVVARWRNPQS